MTETARNYADTTIVRRTVIREYLKTKVNSLEELTDKDMVEIENLSYGKDAPTVAKLTGLGVETVRARRKRIYEKLGISGQLELQQALLAFTLNLLTDKH